MSEERDALETAQGRLKQLESTSVTDDQLLLLAVSLEKEADTYEQVLTRGERRALARESTGPAARLMTFGFALLFVTPMVAMIGVSASKFFRHQAEAAVGMLALGVLLITGTLLAPARRLVAHLVSSEWRFIARARRTAAALRRY
ncbi:MAG: hypothetical protein Q8N23_18880 [Archangium sp.]|nr:hypothetical protein [Archangium sp.]MDP3154750.1 hypothetical protein [Archangium sp.]MDP3573640.1 hypothetical protein [Archangium sp.]